MSTRTNAPRRRACSTTRSTFACASSSSMSRPRCVSFSATLQRSRSSASRSTIASYSAATRSVSPRSCTLSPRSVVFAASPCSFRRRRTGTASSIVSPATNRPAPSFIPCRRTNRRRRRLSAAAKIARRIPALASSATVTRRTLRRVSAPAAAVQRPPVARKDRRGRRTMGEAAAEAAVFLLFIALLVPAAVVGYAVGDRNDRKTKTVRVSDAQAARAEQAAIERAPAFEGDELANDPRENWLTNGGTLANRRYSPLDELDPSNVARLKGVWMTHLGGAGVAAKYSQEAQPLVYDGVVYVPTGNDDVFAVSVDSGLVLWRYEAKLDQTISTVCCGWESRGVALGEGKVFIGQLDGKLVALNQRTGDVEWQKQVVRWQDGGTITAAPLYYDGRVFTGISGGEFGVRGRLTAYDAATGAEAWRFYSIPGRGEVGHDTWPDDPKIWQHGGAPVWQTPAVDPELGLIYFSTGNASNDLDGSKRPGDNLFSASIVAIDAKTGEYRWHFQEVHHDIWDYDAPNPVIRFDAKIDGRMRQGLAQVNKTGWVYMLDRKTAKPLHPIVEKRVPHNRYQRTSPTQP